MPDVPKIVPHRLRTANVQDALAATHPEADALTAFIEQALSPSEREGVLQHLALCADCREAVVLALPAMDMAVLPAAVSLAEEDAEVVLTHSSAADRQSTSQSREGREEDRRQQSERERKSRFAWPSFAWTPLRWATLAAGIAVAVFVVRPALERMNNNEKTNTAINSAQNHAPAPAGAPAADSGGDQQVVPDQLAARHLTKPSAPPSDSGMRLAHNLARVPAGKSPLQSGNDESRSSYGNQSETIQVVAGGSLKETSPDSNLIAQNGSQTGAQNDEIVIQSAPAVVKSKPPLDDTVVNGMPVATSPVVAPAVVNNPPLKGGQNERLQPTVPSPNGAQSSSAKAKKAEAPAMIADSQAEIAPTDKSAGASFGRNTAAFPAVRKQSATWTIAQGVLQRSFDGGQTWQAAARAGHPLLCYASRGLEMWVGGEAGTLLYSSDSGATWNAVAVSFQSHPLDSAITHIDVRGPTERGAAEIVLFTGDHQTWSSPDSGKTWEKK